ncbi:MAG TPA: ABC transporter permease [Thermomicrobiales bacterium]|jgi:peptide/nickel transport system permease protein
MGTLVGSPQQEIAPREASVNRERLMNFGSYIRRNPALGFGLFIIILLLLIGIIGPLFVDTERSAPASVLPDQPPSREFPLGTDDQGRDLFAVVVVGLPLTMRVGFIAGIVGLGIGTILGFTAGYLGGMTDTIIRTLADVLLTVPGLVVLITFASTVKGTIGIGTMALIVASLAWMWPTRTIRSQVLSLRERGYVQLAKISGMSTPEIIFYELVPNLLPYLAGSFVGAVGSAVLASIGLEALGLGPQNEPTMGMTIYWAISFNALIRGLWWWWLTPIALLVLLFVGLMFISLGLDELANPRTRRTNS